MILKNTITLLKRVVLIEKIYKYPIGYLLSKKNQIISYNGNTSIVFEVNKKNDD